MPYELLYRSEADEALDGLEADPAMGKALDAVNDCLDRLEDDPFNKRLGSHIFQTDEFGGINATPVRYDEWFVFWRRGSEFGTLEIITIAQLDL